MNYLAFLIKDLPGCTVPVATSGTTSGHAAGEPFSNLVFNMIRAKFPSNTFKQHEYLNSLYSTNPKAQTFDERFALIPSKPASFLLSRKKKPTEEWSSSNIFEEKQDDTSDTLFVKDCEYHILDTKTTNVSKKAQPPNIISAYKLCQLCNVMFSSNTFDDISIIYIGVSWERKGEKLFCTDCCVKSLFKIPHSELYINWSAANQIQFPVHRVPQDFKGTTKQWCKGFLEFYINSAKDREKDFKKTFIQPFEKYL